MIQSINIGDRSYKYKKDGYINSEQVKSNRTSLAVDFLAPTPLVLLKYT